MSFPLPKYSRSAVNRAGDVLRDPGASRRSFIRAMIVLNNWRSAHGYPLNTFQATLRTKLGRFKGETLVAQRLKRIPSILAKLRRFDRMELARMHDIGGLRAVMGSLSDVYKIRNEYQRSRFEHELVGDYDYVEAPKQDGYKGIHLVYRYKNRRAPSEYQGLRIELQIRTRIQHAWATAVETMGTFLNQALKSSEGDVEWLDFFALASCGFSYLESTTPVPGYEDMSEREVYEAIESEAQRLNVRERLGAFVVAMNRVEEDRQPGSYRLIVLNPDARTVYIRTFPKAELQKANDEYLAVERQIADGENLQAVLVDTGSIDNLRRAYPNYFLDTHEFVQRLDALRTLAV